MKKLSKILFILWIAVLTLNSKVFADDWNLPWVTIITRTERWADETMRLTSYSKRQSVLANRAADEKAL